MKKLLLATLVVLSGSMSLHAADLFEQMKGMFGGGNGSGEESSLDFSPNVGIDVQTIKQRQNQKLDTRTGRVAIETGGSVAYREGNTATQAGQSQTASMSSRDRQ